MENIASRVAILVRAFIYNLALRRKRAEISEKPEYFGNTYPNPEIIVFKRDIIMESSDLSSMYMVNHS